MRRVMIAMLAAPLMAQAAPAPTVSDLGWMTGRWEAGDGGRWTEESWTVPRAGTMFGVSRSGSGDRLRDYEFIRLQAGADGVVAYNASPGGRPAVAFRLVARDGTSATFENPRHDYPQRIAYRRDGGTMVATISAIDGSNPMRWTFRKLE